MDAEGGRVRSLSLEKQRRFLRGDRYAGFQDESLHSTDSGSGLLPDQTRLARDGSSIPLEVAGLCKSPGCPVAILKQALYTYSV